ncbi:MAG: hypothetical protein GKR96_11675 [Gammaproteobacteria bacterium]|nr:hypothetical protein [Gammaproteobacteria bacterium]
MKDNTLSAETTRVFLESTHTLKNVDKDFVSWHKGRPHYYVWAIMVDSPSWQYRIQSAHDVLSPYLVNGYQRQPHVTILPAGFIGKASISKTSLTEVCSAFSPFELSLGQLSSFTGSPCYPVINTGLQLIELRVALRSIAVDPDSQVNDENYVPHLTVGLYDEAYFTDEVAQKISLVGSARDFIDDGEVVVNRIALVKYQTASIKGSLEIEAECDLGSGKLKIASPRLFS